jgi:hypothetical protein
VQDHVVISFLSQGPVCNLYPPLII